MVWGDFVSPRSRSCSMGIFSCARSTHCSGVGESLYSALCVSVSSISAVSTSAHLPSHAGGTLMPVAAVLDRYFVLTLDS